MGIDISSINAARGRANEKPATNNATTNDDAATAQKTNADASAKQDSVQITTQAKQLTDLQNAINDVPDVDLDKIAAVKQEMLSGSYTIDSEKIAEKIIEFER